MDETQVTDAEILAEAKAYAGQLTVSLPDRIQIASLTLNSKLPFKALAIRELLIHRVAELATSAVEDFERGRAVAAIALTRSILETVAVLFVLRERIGQFLVDKDVEELDDFLMKASMGSRNNPNLPSAINILSLIDRMDKSIPRVRATYDSLCEITHPNWAGTMGAFGAIDREVFELKLGAQQTPGFSIGVSALSGTLIMFHQYYNESGDLIQELNNHFEASNGK